MRPALMLAICALGTPRPPPRPSARRLDDLGFADHPFGWEAQGDAGAGVRAALDRQGAAMQLDLRLGDRQAATGAEAAQQAAASQPAKTLERRPDVLGAPAA